MEEINRKQAITIIIAIILVAVSFGYIIASSRPRLMSALEAREIADQAALEWDDNATLCWVYSNWNIVEPDIYAFWDWQEAKEHGDWFFVYYLPTTVTVDNFTYHPRAEVIVFSNTSYQIYTEDNLVFPDKLAPISNWSIDSAEALDIALNNPEVDTYRHDNPNTETVYYLYAYEYSNCIIWNITFSQGGIYDPMIIIHIDASTGEVLLVKENN